MSHNNKVGTIVYIPLDKVKTLEDHLENLRKTRDGLKTELLQLLGEFINCSTTSNNLLS